MMNSASTEEHSLFYVSNKSFQDHSRVTFTVDLNGMTPCVNDCLIMYQVESNIRLSTMSMQPVTYAQCKVL